jgi:hypothetical protein
MVAALLGAKPFLELAWLATLLCGMSDLIVGGAGDLPLNLGIRLFRLRMEQAWEAELDPVVLGLSDFLSELRSSQFPMVFRGNSNAVQPVSPGGYSWGGQPTYCD